MIALAKENPELFEVEAQKYQEQNIKDLCEGDLQCEWRLNGFLFKLNQEASKYKDPTARLNFVIGRFFTYINKNYQG